MQDVKFNYQNISAKVEKDQVTIVNKNLFINTDTFDCFVALAKDGKEVKEVPMEDHCHSAWRCQRLSGLTGQEADDFLSRLHKVIG